MLTLILSLMIGGVAFADGDPCPEPAEASAQTARLMRYAQLKRDEAAAHGSCLAAVGMYDAAASFYLPQAGLSADWTDHQLSLVGKPVPDADPSFDTQDQAKWRVTYVATTEAMAALEASRVELVQTQRRQRHAAQQAAAAAGKELVRIRQELSSLRGSIPAESLPQTPELTRITPRPNYKLPPHFFNCVGAQNAETPQPIAAAASAPPPASSGD